MGRRYLEDGRQRRRSAATFREARKIKVCATAKEAARRAGPTLHSYALERVDHYAGRGAHDVINDRTRREHRRLLLTYALAYFAPEERLRDLDEQRLRGFVDWLCRLPDADGHRLCDRSVRNAVLPLQSRLRHAARVGLLGDGAEPVILLPRRRRGRAYEFDERRFLTREQQARLLAEIPDDWRPFFELLASTGPRISEAIALRVMDADLDAELEDEGYLQCGHGMASDRAAGAAAHAIAPKGDRARGGIVRRSVHYRPRSTRRSSRSRTPSGGASSSAWVAAPRP